MRLILLPMIFAAALLSAGCVKGPLVDFGNRDKPLVDVKINTDRNDDSSAKTQKDADQKSPDRSSNTR